MGLDTTHGAWNGAYSSFMNWRIWVAKQINIDLDKMEGFLDSKKAIKWDTIEDDLKYLLNHSDCDGSITPKRCKKIADRLKELIKGKKVPQNHYDFKSDDDWFVYKTDLFRKGCLKAYKENKNLEFH